MNYEGHTYYSKNGDKYLVLKGAFSLWNNYLEKHPELKEGSFQCSLSKKGSYKTMKEVEKGIFLIVK